MTIKHNAGETVVNMNPQRVVSFDFGSLDTLEALGVEVIGIPKANIPAYLAKYKDDKYIKDCEFQSLISGEKLTKFYFKNCLKGKTKYKPFDIKFYDPEKGYKVKKKKWDDALREYRVSGTLICDELATYNGQIDNYGATVTTYTSPINTAPTAYDSAVSVNTAPTAYDSAVIETASNIAALSGVTTADVISSLNALASSANAAEWAYPTVATNNSFWQL